MLVINRRTFNILWYERINTRWHNDDFLLCLFRNRYVEFWTKPFTASTYYMYPHGREIEREGDREREKPLKKFIQAPLDFIQLFNNHDCLYTSQHGTRDILAVWTNYHQPVQYKISYRADMFKKTCIKFMYLGLFNKN